ncbi:hypothetical protein RI367_000503 [Sorochytrium milnesiophthora]
MTLAEVFGSLNFTKHTVQLITYNGRIQNPDTVAVFEELGLDLLDYYFLDLHTINLATQYQNAAPANKKRLADALRLHITRIALSIRTTTKKVLEVTDEELLIDGPVTTAFGQMKTLFAYAWYANRWCIAKIGDPTLMSAEWTNHDSATQKYQSRCLASFPITQMIQSHQDGLAARPSFIFDVALCVLAALSALAYHCMSHNDIKPGNIVGACNEPHVFVLIDLGSLSVWYAKAVPGTTRGYGDGIPANTPSYDVACLCDVITEMVTGKVERQVQEDEYKELLNVLKQAVFPVELDEKHISEASAPAVAHVFWELAERVKVLATSANISTIDLDIVKPRPRNG